MIVIVFLWLNPPIFPGVSQIIAGLLVFVGVPVVFVLVLGWVIAGFQNPN